MAGQNLAPFPWTPTNVPPNTTTPGFAAPGWRVLAGDWAQVSLSYRSTNSSPVIHNSGPSPGFFFVHALYVPDSDDATAHMDQATMYGGAATNRRAQYRIDPGWWFQVPFDGQMYVIGGGVSDPATCVLDVMLRRGHAERDCAELRAWEAMMRAGGMQIRELADGSLEYIQPIRPVPPRMWMPPIVGTPQEVPSTWIDVPPLTTIQFPDGASRIEAVSDLAAVPGNVVSLTVQTLGAGTRINIAPGLPRSIGHLAQGGACTDGTPATWTPIATSGTLRSVTVWSKLGG